MPPKKEVKKKVKKEEKKPYLGRPSNDVTVGIIGMPNVGKTTLFNGVTNSQNAAENRAFCTSEVATASVVLPDARLDTLAKVWEPIEVVPCKLTFKDSVGLVNGSSEGKGVGNAFLDNLRSVDVLYHVCRAFDDAEIQHVEADIDPVRDLTVVSDELIKKDLETVDHLLFLLTKEPVTSDHARNHKNARSKEVLEQCKKLLAAGTDIREGVWKEEDVEYLNDASLLTAKTVVYLINITEKEYEEKKNKWFNPIAVWAKKRSPKAGIIPICATLEVKLAGMTADEKKASKLVSMAPKIISTAYTTLDLINYLTGNKQEVRSWTVRKNSTFAKAAAVIHPEFESTFLGGEQYTIEVFKDYKTEALAKHAGKIKNQTKEYIVQDGDILIIRTSHLESKFRDCDWTNKAEVIGTWPKYIQEQQSTDKKKNLSKTVDISPFNLKAPFTGHYLLKDTRLFLEPNKRQCLQGETGTGKSTLFEQLAAGAIKDFPAHLHVHHCKEIEAGSCDFPVLETVVRSHEFRTTLLGCRERLKRRIALGRPEGMEELKANLDLVEFQLTKINADTAEDRASKMLRVLGFDEAFQARSTNTLSGGLRMRVALCAAFFIEADLLLLDEPTNHLDFPSVLWLENRLRGYKSSFILICHDRELLENVCTQVLLLDDKKINIYPCGFAEYEKRRAKADKKYNEEIDKFMQRHRNIDFSSPLAKEKKEKADWQEAYNQRMILLAGKFTFPDSTPLPDATPDGPPVSIINLEEVTFSYDVKNLPFIFDRPISINITTNTRMGIMGPNGAGKSTLLKLLTNRLVPTTGTVTHHPTATVAYFAQHHVHELNLEQTPMEFMIAQFPQVEKPGLLRNHLSKVGISGPKAETRMKQLSGGQLSCVIFAKITYICPHLLIMDEPTNFLDLDSVDSLISATNKYKGALLLVSHNRGFLTKCATQYLSIVPGSFQIFGDMKNCEKATYTFIQELEAGGQAGKLGSGALANGPRHGQTGAPAPAPAASGVIGAK